MTNNNNSASKIKSYLTMPDLNGSEPIKILCKFVVLKHQDHLVLIYGPIAEYNYHANLVEKYCQDNSIPCSWSNRPTMLELFDDQTQIRGGGYAEIQTGPGKIIFGGRSTAYGKFLINDLGKILSENILLEGYKHTIQ